MPSSHPQPALLTHRGAKRLGAGLILVGSVFCFGALFTSAQAEELAHVRRLLVTRFCNQCDLKEANLANQNLQGVWITDTKLKRANLRGANLRFARLRNVNLRKADLTNADLTGATLQNVNLQGALLEGAKLPQGAFTNPPQVEPKEPQIRIQLPQT
jgi:uncharacterized protein YjbI with pentapeptide repeats